jgi:hypothetical protein
MLPRFFAVLLALMTLGLASSAVAQEKANKLDEQAKAVAEKFTKAFVMDMNVDSIMKLVAVPFLGRDLKDDKLRVLKKVDAVRQQFLAIMQGRKPLTGKLTFEKVITYEMFLAEKKAPEGENRKAIDEVLKKTDRIVWMRVGPKADGSFAQVTTLVSWRDDQPKVVGAALAFGRPGPKK